MTFGGHLPAHAWRRYESSITPDECPKPNGMNGLPEKLRQLGNMMLEAYAYVGGEFGIPLIGQDAIE